MADSFATGPGSSAERLKAYVLRLEALEEERAATNADMREVRREAGQDGFDVPTLTLLIQRRKKDPQDLIEADGLLETYEAALGCGAAAGGVLSTSRNEDGSFEVKMVTGGQGAEEKLTKSKKARQSAIALAELARLARSEAGA